MEIHADPLSDKVLAVKLGWKLQVRQDYFPSIFPILAAAAPQTSRAWKFQTWHQVQVHSWSATQNNAKLLQVAINAFSARQKVLTTLLRVAGEVGGFRPHVDTLASLPIVSAATLSPFGEITPSPSRIRKSFVRGPHFTSPPPLNLSQAQTWLTQYMLVESKHILQFSGWCLKFFTLLL